MASNKSKILLFGPVAEEAVDVFVGKIQSLQKSKAGPFDVCFVVGSVSNALAKVTNLPLPVYLQEGLSLSLSADVDEDSGCIRYANNIFGLLKKGQSQSGGVFNVGKLVVCALPKLTRMDAPEVKSVLDHLNHPSYVGCDLLLSSEWPQGIEAHMIRPEVGSFDIAATALRARARYHVVPTNNQFGQSRPFYHLKSAASTMNPKHCGRLLALRPVAKVLKDKKLDKFVHALGLAPLHEMGATELQKQMPTNLLPCPFTDDSYKKDDENPASISSSSGLSEAHARRVIAEFSDQQQDYRWKHRNLNASRKRTSRDEESQEVDPSCSRLFIHGLHKDVSGKLQSDNGALKSSLQRYHVLRVSRPSSSSSSSYAFLQFTSHEDAKKCLEDTGGAVTIEGVVLTLKWAQGSPNNNNCNSMNKRLRLTEEEASDSSTLFFRFQQSPTERTQDEIDVISEKLRSLMESTLEATLGGDVKANDEPALQVKLRMKPIQNFGFLDFASHAAASMAIATLTDSTDGGTIVLKSDESTAVDEKIADTQLYWAPPQRKRTNDDEANLLETTNGVKFRRQHFPPDSREDCWFCLASSGCEKHLITTVGESCYVALAKGPIHSAHCLVVPVAHTSRGVFVDSSLVGEVQKYISKVAEYVSEEHDCNVFVWERAIQTKGGYHAHVQVCPVERDLTSQICATLVALSRRVGCPVNELKSDLGIHATLRSSEDDGEYFYAEVITSTVKGGNFNRRRYLHKGSKVPLQFGREVLAVVKNQPDLAHWKACVLDEEKETELAKQFRNEFEGYE